MSTSYLPSHRFFMAVLSTKDENFGGHKHLEIIEVPSICSSPQRMTTWVPVKIVNTMRDDLTEFSEFCEVKVDATWRRLNETTWGLVYAAPGSMPMSDIYQVRVFHTTSAEQAAREAMQAFEAPIDIFVTYQSAA